MKEVYTYFKLTAHLGDLKICLRSSGFYTPAIPVKYSLIISNKFMGYPFQFKDLGR